MKAIFKWLRTHKKLSIVILIVLIIAFFLTRSRNGNGNLEEAQIARGDVLEELILSGAVVADEHAQLVFSTSGKISWINVSEGDTVVRGQALAKIDTIALNAMLQRARADLRAAEANAQEVLDEVKGNDSDESFEEKNTRTAAEVARDKAYEAVVIAEADLRNATLVSPFAGIVTLVANPFVGINVSAAQTQVEVVNPKTIHFQVAADQTEVVDIKAGDSVKIILDAQQEVEIQGTVSHISYTTLAEEVGAVYKVRVEFSGLEENGFVYRVGMTGDAHFTLNKKENVLYAPSDFLKSDENGDYVLTNNGRDKIYVELGLEGEERTEISGVEEGVLIYD